MGAAGTPGRGTTGPGVLPALAGALLAALALLLAPSGAGAQPGAGELARAAGSLLAERVAPLEPEAVGEARLAALFARGDPQAIAAAEARLAARDPRVRRAWLLPPGYDRVDYDSTPPLGYAALALLRESERTGKAPGLEAQLLDTPQGHVAMARRVEGPDGELAGHLLYALDPRLVEEVLADLPALEGLVAIRQRVPGAMVQVAARGEPMQAPGETAPIPGTRWSLRLVTPAHEAALDQGGGALALPLPLAAALAAVAALLAAGLLWRRRAAARARAPVKKVAPRMVVDEGPTRQLEPERGPGTEGIEVVEDAELPDEAGAPAPPEPPAEGAPGALPAHIFRAYDIRGVVGRDLDAPRAERIGRAVGTLAAEAGQQAVAVGADGRLSSPELTEALARGLRASGRDVVLLGAVPTPVAYFAAEYLGLGSCVMVTGSHNPSEYNGFKVMIDGRVLAGDAVAEIRRRAEGGELATGEGGLEEMDIGADYIRRVSEDIPVALGRAFTVVVDCGNGIAGPWAPRLYRALGHDVVELHCEVDGRFPNHHPDPSEPGNLADLAAAVQREGADLGLAFDGDGDRLGVVDGAGTVIPADRLLMVLADSVLAASPGRPVVFDVKCSRRLPEVIRRAGGKPVMSRSGHSMLGQAMRESDAVLGGELSGHLYFRDRWYGFDDALYAGARLLEVLQAGERSPAELFAAYPTGLVTPELRAPVAEGEAHRLMGELAGAEVSGARATTVDGLRLDYPDGWGLVRASNTTPSLVFRFEADDEAALARIQDAIRGLVHERRPGLELPF